MRIALGVSGGIAAYKAAELVRLLQDKGLEVQVVMTQSACEFVTPLTFAALSGRKVITGMFGGEQGSSNVESAIEHIAVAQSIDALVIAPATANILAKMSHGIADDFLTTLCLATKAPVIVAPAMNVNMWEHAATRENLQTLRARGVRVVNPDEGYLACGMTGAGRLASPEIIAQAVFDTLGLREDLKGEVVLVTAGPTEEPLDAVRYISNRSSGKMGYALAEAAGRRGAKVILISGPTHLVPPTADTFQPVRTAAEMHEAVLRHATSANILVMAAAVADFRPVRPSTQKIKKLDGIPSVQLEPTSDILAEASRRRTNGQIIVGFAAETEDLIANAAAKLRSKNLDLIVANDVSRDDAGFDVDTNIVTLLFPDGHKVELEKMSKQEVAGRVLDEIVEIRRNSEIPALKTTNGH
jgi:phosphopantothenoylcysteine decarboxylase/phosphopantothenate--cysteine ligase